MSQPNPSTALAVTVVDELIRNGVRRFVIAPGSRSAALASAVAGHPDADLTVAIDERSAGFHALGMGKAGQPAAVIVTSGTAGANLLPAVVEAEMSWASLIVLTADRPPELREVGANQTIDQTGLFGRHVRWFFEMGVAEDRPGSNGFWRSTVCRVVEEATGERPGPVHINLAFREPLVPLSDDGRVSSPPFESAIDGRADGSPWTRSVPGSAPVAPIPAELAAIERGVVVAGAGGIEGGVADRLAATLGWPLIAEPTAGRRPKQSISTAHLLASHPGFVSRHRPDVALVLGRVGLSRPLAGLLSGVPTIVSDGGAWSDPGRSATLRLAGIPQVDAGSVPARSGGWRRAWFDAERVARSALDACLDQFDTVSEMRVARDTARAAGGILVVASSMPVRDLDIVMEPGDTRIVSNRGASGIDGFVSTVLGVATVEGSAVALAGDLSMLHDQNGLLVDRRPDVVFVVVDNDGGGIFSFLPQASLPGTFERLFATPHGRSFERYAAFHGVGYHPVDTPGELIPAIGTARSAGGVQLVVVETDRAANVEQHRHVTGVVHAALTEQG
ncbi:MAG: 2-succinyl-5-enolpyruvyl-6-hydroxy-3-cyclohexene-1-carboxylic-acid synthase [Acidimicrobiia bacterium]